MSIPYVVVNKRTDTLELNVKGKLSEALDDELHQYQSLAKEAEGDIKTVWSFQDASLYIKPHGSGTQWLYILDVPGYFHLQVGRGRLNGNVAMVRCYSLFLHQYDEGKILAMLYRFLANFLETDKFSLQVREVHRCVDIAGWVLTKEDEECFVTRASFGHRPDDEVSSVYPEVKGRGRKLRQFDFSKTAPHSCCIYNKSREITQSGKGWLKEIWLKNGWDGKAQITRIEFRYDRECLREMGVEDPYEMLCEFDSMWAYSTQKWLRHVIPSGDSNQSRWLTSPVWEVVQKAPMIEVEAEPAVRRKKIELDAQRVAAGTLGYLTAWAARSDMALDAMEDGFRVLGRGI